MGMGHFCNKRAFEGQKVNCVYPKEGMGYPTMVKQTQPQS